MLRMYAVDECKVQADAWKPISDDNLPSLVEWTQKDKVTLTIYQHDFMGF